MNIKIFLYRYNSILIAIFFFLMGIISIFALASTHIIYYNTDLIFHWYRLNELHFDLLQHTLPQFDTHSTTPYGLATMTYYPYMSLLPFSLLTLFIKRPVTLIYTIYFLITIIRYIIGYFSYKAINNSKRDSFIFTILYNASPIIFNCMIRDGDLGELLAITFLPIAFFGMIKFLKSGNWLMLSTGLTMVIFSHILSALMLIGVLILVTLLNIRYLFNWRRLIKLILAVCLSMTTTAIFWIPVIYNLSLNQIVQPQKFSHFSQGLISQLTATNNQTYGLVEILGIFIIIFIKKMNWQQFQLWIIGLFCLLINVSFVGDSIIKVIPQLLIFQFSYRFSFIAHIIFAYLLTKFVGRTFHNRNFNYLPICILIPILLFMQIGNQYNTIFLLRTRHVINTPHFQLPSKAKGPYELQYNNDDQSFADLRHSNYNMDYAPKLSEENVWMFSKYYTIEFDKHHYFKSLGHFNPNDNGIQVNVNHKNQILVLPMVQYRGYRYDILMNGKKLSNYYLDKQYTKKHALVSIKNIPTGKYTFQLKPHINPIVQYAYNITLIGMLIHLILWLWQSNLILIRKK